SFDTLWSLACSRRCRCSFPSGKGERSSSALKLARRLALSLAHPEFRASFKAELDRSPFPEGKLHLQRLLQASDHRVSKDVARLSGSAQSDVEADAREAVPLEVYFPVPAHRAAWSGGSDVLVASAREDRENPVGYDVNGRRQVLSAVSPPATPVLAVVPVETNFDQPLGPGSEATCTECSPGGTGGSGTGTSAPPPGMYMTYSHFVQDFEGWLKGEPEFEFHILGQSGTTDSLRDYQCAGNAAGGYYRFDQNALNWSGSVLLFSQSQLNSYRTAHPNQNFRIIALEDDDTGCAIKFDGDRFRRMVAAIQTAYPSLTGSKDTANFISKWVKRANALQKILSAVYSFITTQDDLIGNAIEDVVVGVSYPGANWIIKGESNVTNGWIKLEMR
ncbi:MAG TPA: hypothetical protein VHH32_10370, partial [Gemmatimonadales bacterium]|nr:hypothetical protein [Gemmatimonadales bacterium]